MTDGRRDDGRPGDGPGPEFPTVWRGFDPDQVRAYVQLLTGRLQDLESRLDRTQRQLEEARRERDRSRMPAANPETPTEVSPYVTDLLRRFDEEVEDLRRKAEADATGIVARAREEADRMRAEMAPVRDETMDELRAMHAHLVNTIRALDEVLKPETAPEEVVVLEEVDEVPAEEAAVPTAGIPEPPGTDAAGGERAGPRTADWW